MKCSVAILYEGITKPVFVGITQDQQTLVLVKQQILREAREARDAAYSVGDEVLIAEVEGTLRRLERTLDLVIPPEVEHLYVTDGEVMGGHKP